MRLHIRGSLKVQSDFHSSCRSFLLAEVWLDRHRTWESVRVGVGDDLNVWWILHFLFPIILFDAVTNRNEWQLWKEAHQPESLLQRSWSPQEVREGENVNTDMQERNECVHSALRSQTEPTSAFQCWWERMWGQDEGWRKEETLWWERI